LKAKLSENLYREKKICNCDEEFSGPFCMEIWGVWLNFQVGTYNKG